MVLRPCEITMNLMIFFSVFCFFLLIIGLSLDSLAWYTDPVSWLQHTVQNHIVPLHLKPLLIFNFPLIPNNPCPLKFSFSLSSLFWLTPSGPSKDRWNIMCFCVVFPDSFASLYPFHFCKDCWFNAYCATTYLRTQWWTSCGNCYQEPVSQSDKQKGLFHMVR